MRKQVYASVIGVLLVLSVFSVLQLWQIKPAYATDWLAGWNYRKSHVIEASSGAGTNYQIKLNVHFDNGADSVGNVYLNGSNRPDFGDVRFTNDDKETLLDYWIEDIVESNTSITKPIHASGVDSDGTLYAGANDSALNGYIYKSTDEGQTWSSALLNISGIDEVKACYVAANSYIYVSAWGTTMNATSAGLWRSINDGSSWTRVLAMTDWKNCIWAIDENSTGALFAGGYTRDTTANASVYRSTDSGATWTNVFYNSSARHVHDVAVDPYTNYIYATLGDDIEPWNYKAIYRSTNGGTTWTEILSSVPQCISIGFTSGYRFFGTDASASQGIYRTSNDSSATCVLDTSPLNSGYFYWIRTDSIGRVYASCFGILAPNYPRIYVSEDNGTIWSTYRTFTTFGEGSEYASQSTTFTNSILYYSVLDSGRQNGMKLYLDYATFWVEVSSDLSTISQTIYIYYGKSDATSLSNGINTFLAFDNFDDNSISGDWSSIETDAGCNQTETNGEMQLGLVGGGWQCSGVYWNALSRKLSDGMRITWDMKQSGTSYAILAITPDTTTAFWDQIVNTTDLHFATSSPFRALGGNTSGLWDEASSADDCITYHKYELTLENTNITVSVDNVLKFNDAHSIQWVDQVAYTRFMAMYTGTQIAYFDNFYMTKYVSPEPVHGTWGNQETAEYGEDKTFGYTANGTLYDSLSGGYMVGSNFTMPVSAPITAIRAYIAGYGGSTSAIGILYDDSGGVVGSPLTNSSQVTVTTSTNWYDFPISYNGVVTTTYWLMVFCNSPFYYYYDTSSTNKLSLSNNYGGTYYSFPTIPANVGGFYGDYVLSIYAVYTSESAAPTFSPITSNTTIAGNPVQLNCTISDNDGVSGYIFSWNNTGSWTNTTWTSGSSAGHIGTWNDTIGNVVSVKIYGNDTLNYWGESIQYDFTLTAIDSVSLVLTNPKNLTYSLGTIPVQFSASGGTIDHLWFNCKNGSNWVYVSNQTYTTSTNMTGFVEGSYTFYGYANNTDGTSTSENVSFSVSISSSYYVVAASGSATDIQVAVDDVHSQGSGYGIVYLPSGTYEFNPSGSWTTIQSYEGISIIGNTPTFNATTGRVDTFSTTLRMNYELYGDPYGHWTGVVSGVPNWIQITGTNITGLTTRIAYIDFEGYRTFNSSSHSQNLAIYISNVIDYRVDHNRFNNTCAGAVYTIGLYCSGVIDHNYITNYPAYATAGSAYCDVDYGTQHYRSFTGTFNQLWDNNTLNVLGHYTNYSHYIENNYFTKWRHSISANDGAHIVIRYNTFVGGSGFGDGGDAHGTYNIVGTRAMEIYGNSLTDGGKADIEFSLARYRGGAGVYWNNTNDETYAYLVLIAEGSVEECWPHVYIWNNSAFTISYWSYQQEGSDNQLHPQLNLDYFTYAMPDYTAYPYPHYLTLSGEETPPIILAVTSPTNTTYTSSTVSVELSATGGTVDKIIWNCTFTSGTVVYANQTYTVATSMTLLTGSYIFHAVANNTDGNIDALTVWFSVSLSGGSNQLIVNVWWSGWW